MKNNANILSGPPFDDKWTYTSAGEYFLEMISKHGSTPALINMETGEELTYSQVLEKSLKLAISLEKMGLKLNDRIGICSENNLNFSIAVFSSIFLGTTMCPLNPSYTERELIHTLTISKPKYIAVSISCLPVLKKIVKDLPWSPKLILLYPEFSNSGIPSLPDLISKISDSEMKKFKLPKIDQDEHILLISVSSGTTGLPKGVMLTDKNVLNQLRYCNDFKGHLFDKNSSSLGILPLFHIFGYFIMFLIFSNGLKLIMFSKFNERLFLEAVEKYRIDFLTLVPPLMVFLATSPLVDNYNLSCVKSVLCGGAPLTKKIEEGVKKRFNNIPVVRSVYGLTEATSVVTISLEVHKVNSAGTLIRGVTAKVVPLDGNSKEALGPNCKGELCFKGDSIMKGYCGDEAATKAIIDEDGFLHTGDVGYYDEDGYFFIVDRVKELIKYKGFQVPPAELESILLTHPSIRDAAVVGLPDELAGELPLAFVVKQPEVEITAEEMIKYVNERISSQKRLRGGVRFIDAIPKNPSGKILRRELRNLLN